MKIRCPMCGTKIIKEISGGMTGKSENHYTIYNNCVCYKCESEFIHHQEYVLGVRHIIKVTDIEIHNHQKVKYYQTRMLRKEKLKRLRKL